MTGVGSLAPWLLMHSNEMFVPGILAYCTIIKSFNHTLGRKVGFDEDAVNVVWRWKVRMAVVQNISCPREPFHISSSKAKHSHPS